MRRASFGSRRALAFAVRQRQLRRHRGHRQIPPGPHTELQQRLPRVPSPRVWSLAAAVHWFSGPRTADDGVRSLLARVLLRARWGASRGTLHGVHSAHGTRGSVQPRLHAPHPQVQALPGVRLGDGKEPRLQSHGGAFHSKLLSSSTACVQQRSPILFVHYCNFWAPIPEDREALTRAFISVVQFWVPRYQCTSFTLSVLDFGEFSTVFYSAPAARPTGAGCAAKTFLSARPGATSTSTSTLPTCAAARSFPRATGSACALTAALTWCGGCCSRLRSRSRPWRT